MVFSSLFFLWTFLPIVVAVYYLLPRKGRNLWLLIASLGFYAYGEGWYTLVMVGTILFHWLAALRTWPVPIVIGIDLAVLVAFKYLDFLITPFGFSPIGVHLPIGISFFLFQAMSYVIDVGRKDVQPTRSLKDFGAYLALFPQLIAGPIVRYSHVARQMSERRENWKLMASGIERFIQGFAKKVLLANTLARGADLAFTQSAGDLGIGAAWWGAICYTLQIYFDFSGYSDMAVGLGRIFGFRFLENFNLPYKAFSIQDFWRRWHISLSTWFRDYLYIPLGGNRMGLWTKARNQLIVFALCGLWHGASWNFLAWGLWHGSFLGLESTGLGRFYSRHRFMGTIYALLIVLLGWVLFRADTLGHAWHYYQAMAGLGKGTIAFWDPEVATALLLGSLFALGFPQKLLEQAEGRLASMGSGLRWIVRGGVHGFIYLLALIWLAAASGNPFIYFRF